MKAPKDRLLALLNQKSVLSTHRLLSLGSLIPYGYPKSQELRVRQFAVDTSGILTYLCFQEFGRLVLLGIERLLTGYRVLAWLQFLVERAALKLTSITENSLDL